MQNTVISVNFDWLINPELRSSVLTDAEDVYLAEIPMPAHVGLGEFESWKLNSGLHVYRARYKFQSGIRGQLIPLAKVASTFDEPTLIVHTLPKGRVIHKDARGISNDLVYGDGVDLFRFSNEISVVPVMDTSQDIEMVTLVISENILRNLIGQSLFLKLIKNLNFSEFEQAVLKSIPDHVHQPLQNCLKSEYSVNLKKLWAQARVLDFITNLSNHFCETEEKRFTTSQQTRKKVKAIHDYLINLEGKLPTINTISSQFGHSTRLLNEEFQSEYGDSIFGFIINHRLNCAHEAIRNSNIPLKQLAQKLGYAHVNHFSAAFKKKFGYPPSYLRNKNKC